MTTPSKFLFPDKTTAAITSPPFNAFVTYSGSSPEFPIQVTYPYSAVVNSYSSKYFCTQVSSK